MNTKQLECFIEVAESLNFTTASTNLFISQPAVTHQIKTLEAELEVTLFQRTKKKVSLTPAGENFYTDAKEILSRILIAKKKANTLHQTYTLKLAIGYTNTTAEKQLLPYILKQFRLEHPNIFIFLKKLDHKHLTSHLMNQKMDVIFTYAGKSAESGDALFCPLIKSKYYALMNTKHVLVNNPKLTPDALKTETILLPEASACSGDIRSLVNYLISLFPISNIHYCDCADTAALLMKSGLGIAISPDFDLALDDDTVAVELDLDFSIEYGISYLKTNPQGKYIQRILELTKEVLDANPVPFIAWTQQEVGYNQPPPPKSNGAHN